MSGIGLFMSLWLLVGLLVGLKAVYLDDILGEENVKKAKSKIVDDNNIDAFNLVKKKSNFLAIMTLFGFVAVFLDIKRTLKKARG